MRTKKFYSQSLRKTRGIAHSFAGILKPGDTVGFKGSLGAGKTVFIKGVSGYFGFNPSLVTSASFVLVKEYPCYPMICHADFYRIDKPEHVPGEIFDYIESGRYIVLIEWADKADLNYDFSVIIEQVSLKKRIIVIEGMDKRLETMPLPVPISD